MEFGPILRAMWRNKLGVLLVTLQVAFTMTIIVNAVFIINERSRLMVRPSGLDEANLFYLQNIGFSADYNESAVVREDLDFLRRYPGIVNATVTNAIPVSGSGSSSALSLEPDDTAPGTFAAYYEVDEQALDTMGLELIAGENFSAAEITERGVGEFFNPSRGIVSLALAETLFPQDPHAALGQTVYRNNSPLQITGIVRRLQAPWPDTSFVEQSILLPMNSLNTFAMYLVRTEPGQRDRLMVEIEEALATSRTDRIIREVMSLEETRRQTYMVDSAMSTVLFAVIVILIFITSMGIVGLTVFGINRRRKQIGTRRALGATRTAVVRYFLLENFLITGVGVILGALLTISFNIFLVQSFDMPRIDWYYTPLGMLALLLAGQLAVLGPSGNAARIPPAIATRSV
ncbi:MAG: FtsX-like permease family protein [Pseudohongiellaceae bacterium]